MSFKVVTFSIYSHIRKKRKTWVPGAQTNICFVSDICEHQENISILKLVTLVNQFNIVRLFQTLGYSRYEVLQVIKNKLLQKYQIDPSNNNSKHTYFCGFNNHISNRYNFICLILLQLSHNQSPQFSKNEPTVFQK